MVRDAMNGCPDDFSVYKAGQGPHGNGGIFEDGRPIRNMNDEIIDLRDGVQRDAAQRAGIFTRLRNHHTPYDFVNIALFLDRFRTRGVANTRVTTRMTWTHSLYPPSSIMG